MGRLFFLLAVAIVVYLLIKSFRKTRDQEQPKGDTPTEDMVRCAHCGVHLPRSESIMAQGQTFCCAAHRDAYRK